VVEADITSVDDRLRAAAEPANALFGGEHDARAAIFFNQGRCCSAGSRLLIHKKIFDKVPLGEEWHRACGSGDPRVAPL
jgi:hypothetical protein